MQQDDLNKGLLRILNDTLSLGPQTNVLLFAGVIIDEKCTVKLKVFVWRARQMAPYGEHLPPNCPLCHCLLTLKVTTNQASGVTVRCQAMLSPTGPSAPVACPYIRFIKPTPFQRQVGLGPDTPDGEWGVAEWTPKWTRSIAKPANESPPQPQNARSNPPKRKSSNANDDSSAKASSSTRPAPDDRVDRPVRAVRNKKAKK
jgi:hypothetical protein